MGVEEFDVVLASASPRRRQLLADAGVAIDRVLEAGEAPLGATALLNELAKRGIPVQCNARIDEVSGAARLESATIACDAGRETLACDLLVASPCIVSE